jgi:transposase
VGRARVGKLAWPLPPDLDDDVALTRALFHDEHRPQPSRPEPDWARIHLELRKKHVTKYLLWEEYKAKQPTGYQYSQFCERYAPSPPGAPPPARRWFGSEARRGSTARLIGMLRNG